MDSPLWKLLGFLIAAALLFLAPAMSILERQDDVAFTVILTETNRFADSVRDTGYITPNMYSDFINRINATGNTFDISIRHIKSTINPVYRQNGPDLEFTGEYEVVRISVSETEIMAKLFPADGSIGVFDKARRYEMKQGDLIFVEVKNRGKTMATAIRDMMLLTDTDTPALFVRSGGMVRNEAY
jgi:hypothetical protein